MVAPARRDVHAHLHEMVPKEEVHELDERVPERRVRVRVRAAPRDDELAEDGRAPLNIGLEEALGRRVLVVEPLRRAVAAAFEAASGWLEGPQTMHRVSV